MKRRIGKTWKAWEPNDKRLLRNLLALGYTHSEIAKMMGRTVHSISGAHRLIEDVEIRPSAMVFRSELRKHIAEGFIPVGFPEKHRRTFRTLRQRCYELRYGLRTVPYKGWIPYQLKEKDNGPTRSRSQE